MNSQSVFSKCLRTGLLVVASLFFVHGAVQAADTNTAGNRDGEPCQLTPVEKYLERHPESQWPPSRRDEIRRCDNTSGQQVVSPARQEKKVQKK